MQYYGNPQRRKFLRQTVLTPPKDATGAQYAGQMMAGGGKPLSKMTKTERREAIKPVEVVQNTTGTFPVVLTTFDMAIKDARYLRGFQWKCVQTPSLLLFHPTLLRVSRPFFWLQVLI